MARSPYGLFTAPVEPRGAPYRQQISFFAAIRRWRGPTYVYLIIFGAMNVFWYSLLSWCLSSGACYSTNIMVVNKQVAANDWVVNYPNRHESVDDASTTLRSIAPTNTTPTTDTTTVTMATNATTETSGTTAASTSATSAVTEVTKDTSEVTKETTKPTEAVTTAAPVANSSHDNNTGVEDIIKSGEMCKTVCPPITWGQWSICSKHCGGGRRFRHATYQFVCTNSELCPPNKVEEEACNTNECVVKDDYGPIIPYPNNPLNPAIYLEKSVNFSCGTWVSEYAQLHNDIITGKKPPKYLVYSTGKSGGYPPAGGLADRLRGITTLFYLAVATGADYGLFTWPCAPVLAQYVVERQLYVKDKFVLEIGAGTGVPGLTAAKCGAHVTLSDHHDNHHVLEALRKSCVQNGLDDVKVIPLSWGCFTPSLVDLPPQDIVLASDCFYDTNEFEDVIVTAAYLMEKNPQCEIWATYQERSAGRSLSHLLHRWGMTMTTLPTDHFPAPGQGDLIIEGIGSNVTISNQTIHLWQITKAS